MAEIEIGKFDPNRPNKPKPKVGGYLYWKTGLRGPVAEIIPLDSGAPPPNPYLAKHELMEDELNLSFLILEKRYPYP